MDKQKQIEEMEKVIDNVQTYGTKWYPDKYEPFESRIENDDIAYEFYNAGYRKIPDGAVVLTREEHQKYLAFKIIEPQVRGCLDREKKLEKRLETIRKETAEKFSERMKEIFKYEAHQQWIDEICKEITEGKDDDTSEVGK